MARRPKAAETTGGRHSTRTRVTLLCLLLAAVVVSAGSNTLHHGFVFDDVTLIQQNTDVTELNWERILGRTGYRPIRTLTYALNFALGGTNPFGYHLFNVLLHAANAILTFFLFRHLLGRLDASFLGAMLFAMHPVQTASVAYVSGRKDLLAAFFLLLAALLYVGWRRRGGRVRAAFTGLSVALAVLSKEVAVVFPALLVLIDFFGTPEGRQHWDGKSLKEALKKSARLYILLATVALAAVYYTVVWTEASRMAGYWGGSLTAQWATSFKLFVHYLRLALAPYPLLADYTGVFPVSTGFTEPATVLCVLVFAAYLGLALRLCRRHPLVTLGMGWFLVPLLPVLQIVGFHEIAADHFLYLPMVGASLIFGHLGALAGSSRNTNVLAWAFLLIVFAVCSILTVSRNRVWASQLTLWEDTYEKAPGSYRANANLGQLYWARFEQDPMRNSQLRARAVRLLERAAELDPTDSLPLSNLGAIYREWGWDEWKKGNQEVAEARERRALSYLSRAVSLDPEDVWAYSNLGDVRKDLGLIWSRRANPIQAQTERHLAIEAYEKAISLGSPNPRFPLVYFKLAMVKVDQRRFAEAVPWLKRSVRAPGLAEMWELPYWMGYCYLATGRVSAAIPHLRRTVDLRPYPAGLRLLAYALEGVGEAEEAIALYGQALRQNPQSFETHYLLAAALQGQGRTGLARQHLLRALQLVEGHPRTPSTNAFRRGIKRQLEEGRNEDMAPDPEDPG